MRPHIAVYRIDTRQACDLSDMFFDCLPAAERLRAENLKQEQDRQNRKLAYAALFWLLHQHSHAPVAQIIIHRDPFGKPLAVLPAGCTPLHVNLSHSEHCVLIAIAACSVGVDVECLRTLDIEPLVRDYFPQDALDERASPHEFFAFWTAKEAVLKALGTGLRLPPAQVVLATPTLAFQPLLASPTGSGLDQAAVAALSMKEGYVGAVAAMHSNPTYSLRDLDAAALNALAKC